MTVAVFLFGPHSQVAFDLDTDKSLGEDASIRFKLEPLHVRAKLANGTSLDSRGWFLRVYDQTSTNAPKSDDESFGAIRLTKHGDCMGEATLKSTHFSRLLSALQVGKVPDYFEVTVLGVTSRGDSSMWDPVEVTSLRIDSLRISMPLHGQSMNTFAAPALEPK